MLSLLLLMLTLGASASGGTNVVSKPLTLDLWPATPPGKATVQPESELPSRGDGVRRVTGVSQPSLTVFRAEAGAGARPAVLICPGGGYKILAVNKEGTEIAEWLNSLGITAILLKYRVPDNREGALQDVQRAVGLVRRHAKDWGIDQHRVGVMGFSAGGHLAARLSTNWKKRAYPLIDAADRLSCRPDFVILVYPAYLGDRDGRVASELSITSRIPRTFIVQTQDDKKFVGGTIAYEAALRKAKVPCEFHLFPEGGHGYGLHPAKSPVSTWPEACAAWLRTGGVISGTRE